MLRTRKKPTKSESSNTDTSTRETPRDWISVVFSATILVSCAVWGLMASLLAWHFYDRARLSREDVLEQREMFADLKEAGEEERKLLAEEVMSLDSLREQALAIMALLTDASAPANRQEVEDSLVSLYSMLHEAKPDAAQVGRLKERLAGIGGVASSSGVAAAAPRLAGGYSAQEVLDALAEEGLFNVALIPEYLDRASRRLDMRRDAVKPPEPSRATPPADVATAAPTASNKPAGPPPIPYRNAPFRFSMAFPAGWTVKDRDVNNGVQAISPSLDKGMADKGYVVVTASQMLVPVILREFEARQLALITEATPGTKVVGQGDMDVGGGPGRFALCSVPRLGQEFMTMQVVAIRAGFGYVFTFSARADLYPRLEKDFQFILQSLQLP